MLAGLQYWEKVKPGVPPGFAATPMQVAPACHAAALALQPGPAVAPGTDLRDSWPAVWAQRAVQQHAAWGGYPALVSA